MAKYDYDCIVIGGGAAGLTAAKLVHGLGKSVALIEKNKLGGECTWTGCIPSKALIHVALRVHNTRLAEQFGITATGTIDGVGVMNHVRKIVRQVYQTHTPEVVGKDGLTIVEGSAQFIDSHTVRVNGKTITGRRFIIATGSYPFVPSGIGLESVPFLTNRTLFDLPDLPKSLIIVGAGSVGIEMASALNRLGVAITVIERGSTILSREDRELVEQMHDMLEREGVTLMTNMAVENIKKNNDDIVVSAIDINGKKHEVSAENILIAVGRRAGVDELGLEYAGVKYTKNNIIVDQYLRTSASHIYACGDVAGPYQFSHMAWHQAVVAGRNAVMPFFKKKMRYDTVGWVMFSSPELATMGLTEQEAREKYGDTIYVYRQRYDTIDRGRVDLVSRGMGKFICDKRGRIVGAHILGPCAGELMHELQVAKKYSIKFSALQDIVHTYPTYSELVWHGAKKAYRAELEKNIFVRIAKKIVGRK